jgi:Short-chain alcohol dehydrogenase of unknown specificity
MKDLKDKVVVITGGASGIGLAMARRFAADGAKLVLADIEQGALDAAVTELADCGTDVIGHRTDVADYASVEVLEARAIERFGKVHVLCNNAGVSMPALWCAKTRPHEPAPELCAHNPKVAGSNPAPATNSKSATSAAKT